MIAQESLWNVVRQPLWLPIYLVIGLAVSFWGPLNFPDASDLAGGTSIEDSGIAPKSLSGKNWGVFTSVNDSGWKEQRVEELDLKGVPLHSYFAL